MSFISSFYLWLLPLISVPLIIYLFNRNKYKTVLFSSIAFLNEINKKSIRKINIINILLIIIRTLIILFFILMMSRPFYNSNYDSSKDISSVALIGVDNSFSMHHNIDKNINNIITNIIKPLNDNSRVIIFSLDDYKILYDDNKDKINSKLIKIRKSYMPNSLEGMANFTDDYNNYLNKYLFVISDGQENLFSNNFKKNDNWHINYVNMNIPTTNLSVVSAKTNSNLILTNDIFQIEVSIKNNGYQDIENHLLELFINDINIGKRYISLSSGDLKKVLFDLTLPSYGEHLCLIKLENDDINEDNTLFLNINLKEKINIDIIDPNHNKYLKNILQSFNIKESVISLNYYDMEGYLNSGNLNNILFVIGLNNITDEIASKVKLIARNNKIKIITFPDINDKSFTSLENILPAFKFKKSYRGILSEDQYLEIDVASIKNIDLKNIYSNNPLRNIKIFNYLVMDSDTNSVMALNNGDMLLNIYKKNNIEVILSSISLDLNSSNYPLKGNILPFFKNLIMDYELLEYYDNSTIYEKYNELDLSDAIISPSNQEFVFNNDRNTEFSELGFYKIRKGYSKKYFSLNVNSEEKASNFLNNEEIELLIPIEARISNNASEIIANINNTEIGYDLWIILFVIIILLLFIEMYLSTSTIKND